jgi:hypothetical protein
MTAMDRRQMFPTEKQTGRKIRLMFAVDLFHQRPAKHLIQIANSVSRSAKNIWQSFV